MQFITRATLVLALVSTSGLLRAEEKFDPAARANVIAPLIDEQTFAVLHADLARIAADPILSVLADWLPDAKQELQRMNADAFLANLRAFVRAGGHDIFIVVSTADISIGETQNPTFAVVPLAKEADAKVLSGWLATLYETTERRGDVLLAGSRRVLERLKAIKPEPRPEVVKAFEAAGDTAAQALLAPPRYWRRVIEEMMPTLPELMGGGPSTVLTRGVVWAALGADPPTRFSLRLVIQSQDPDAAAALRRKWGDVWRLLECDEEFRQTVANLREIVALLTPEVQGDRLVLTIDQQKGLAMLLAVLKPAVQNARANAHRVQSMNNLRQIALAMHCYHEAHKAFPAAASHDAQGKPLLSWRVHILPYLGEENLYKQFHLDEPWDSPHNRPLVDKMPAIYRSPGSKLADKGSTNYVVPVGPETMFPPGGKGIAMKDITDGTSHTVMALEVDDDHAVVWTKPEDLAVDLEHPAKGLGGLWSSGFNSVFADGAAHFLPKAIDAQTLRSVLTRAGREPIEPGKF